MKIPEWSLPLLKIHTNDDDDNGLTEGEVVVVLKVSITRTSSCVGRRKVGRVFFYFSSFLFTALILVVILVNSLLIYILLT